MTDKIAPKRLSKVAKEFNIATTTIVEFLDTKGIEIDSNPNTKINPEIFLLLQEKFQSDKLVKEYAEDKTETKDKEDEKPSDDQNSDDGPEILIKSNLFKRDTGEEPETEEKKPEEKEKVKPDKESTEKKEEKKKEKEKPEEKKPVQETEEEKKEEKKTKEEEKKTETKKEAEEKKEKEETKDKEKAKDKQEEKPKAKSSTKKTSEKKTEEKPEEAKEKEDEKEEPQLKVLGKIKLEKKQEEEEKKAAEEEKKAEKKAKEEKEKPEVKKEAEKKEEKKPEKQKPKEEKEPKEKKKKEAAKKDQKEEKAEKPKEDGKAKDPKKEDEEELQGLTILGKIDVDQFKKEKKKDKRKPVASTSDPSSMRGKRRRRIVSQKDKDGKDGKGRGRKKKDKKPEVDEKEIKEQISQTLAKLQSKQQGSAVSRSKIKKQKKKEQREKEILEAQEQDQKKVIEVIEFITVNELANVMDVSVTEVITTCMNLGLMVNINQRLDAETITIVADEYGYDVDFKKESMDEIEIEQPDSEENMVSRAPVVTIMGHVDHGKTSLLDHIRKSHITDTEAGGITQHIGAYEVELAEDKKIVFLDTPGHEAFTSMRARGAKVTDIVIIVIAADDSVMPQTKEAISHAQAANVPIVFAINKMDKPGASPDRIKEQLADMNILVEDWGGKYQSQEISAKKGLNIDDLLEKVLLEAEMLELKADPKKRGVGTVVEATLDKGKGITTTILVQSGNVSIGDPILAGAFYGRVKAMVNEKGQKLDKVGPATPVEILGFDGAPTAGDIFYVTENEHQAKETAYKRKRLIREQGIRATKHVTLDEIGRRIALGNFKELNVIIKGDVDGSVEALSDSVQKLSNDEVQVNVIHKGVGQISETDVMLASASDAVIIGFQVRPSLSARKMAENEQIDIRSYSVIYDAIEEIKLAIEGLLAPTEEEKVVCNIEVREVFKISKVGTVAGCMVQDGKITRNTQVRVLREGVVIYTGEIDTLKRFKDDVKEVAAGYECGIGIKNFNDIKVGDIIEGFTIEQVKRKL